MSRNMNEEESTGARAPLTIIVGPRRSGKTHRAVQLAKSLGPRVCLVVKHGLVANARSTYPDIDVTTERNRAASKTAGAVFVLDGIALRQAGRFIAPGVDVIMTCSPPHTVEDDALLHKMTEHGAQILNAEAVKIVYRNHRKGCPARTEQDVSWVLSHWNSKEPLPGGRPKPIGCSGCTCGSSGPAESDRAIREEFEVHLLNEEGIAKARELAELFSDALTKIERITGPGREAALVKTKLQEASFFAKRGLAQRPDMQRQRS
jgi:hypothetical protein